MLYAGNVRHRRTGPRAYQFTYGVYYFALDLDELPDVDRRIRGFAYNRRGLLSFLDRDHIGAPTERVRDAARAHLTALGMDPDALRITLLTNTRVFGYVFNPVSFFFVRSSDGALRHVMAEVHNTHGERHLYDLHSTGADADYTARATKQFYVSPFIAMDARYEFRFREDGGRIAVGIDEYRGDALFFQADLHLAPRPLTNANVARMLVRYPFVTGKTIALIHWHGLKLWLRGARFHRHVPDTEVRP